MDAVDLNTFGVDVGMGEMSILLGHGRKNDYRNVLQEKMLAYNLQKVCKICAPHFIKLARPAYINMVRIITL